MFLRHKHMMLSSLLLLPFAIAYQLRTTLRTPESFVQPSTQSLFIETLHHVSKAAYCALLADLATDPIPENLAPNTDIDVINYLLQRTALADHEKGLLKLSLATSEFAPAASFNGTSTAHNCSSVAVYDTIYTDFKSPFEYTSNTIVRYRQPANLEGRERRTLTGYGAHLALKRTDYLVIDDSNPTKAAADSKKIEPLKLNQMSNIGMRAVSRIMSAEDPLLELEDISQNFPVRATKLLASKVSAELKNELRDIQVVVRGDIFMVNGVEIVPDPDKLFPTLRAESALSRDLQALGYSNAQVINLLTFDLETVPKPTRFDVRSPAIIYLNDFEKDDQYKTWPTSLETFMRPLYPGQFHTIRRNAHTIVMKADFTAPAHLDLVANFATFVTRGLPIRWGIVPVLENERQVLAIKAWTQILRKRGSAAAADFLSTLLAGESVEKAYRKLEKKDGQALKPLSDIEDPYDSSEWIDRFGTGSIFANGQLVENDENLMQRISAQLRDDTMMVQESLLEGGIADSGDLQDFFLGDRALTRYTQALFGPRTYASLQEIQDFTASSCSGDYEIFTSGSNWPSFDKYGSSACVHEISGPERLIINGRVLTELDADDVPTLLAQETDDLSRYTAAAGRAGAPMSPRILTLLRSSQRLRTILPPLKSEMTHFTVGDEANCVVQVDVYVDPLSENAQKWSSILRTLSTIPQICIRVQLVPKFNIKELPLKRFYRYLLPASPSFSDDGIEFDGIPSDLLVFSLDVWNNWVVSPLLAAVDLDNLHLGEESIDADFEVSYILVEGHAKEVGSSAPPRGAQLTLSNDDGDVIETIIMANLGYFQFKALPGVWTLGIKTGRSSEIFDLDNREINVSSWAGATIYPRLTRRPGQAAAEVLDAREVASKGGVWSKFKNLATTDHPENKKHADINIFTVASGHLYERFVYIMISSVMAHTDHSVKFWFISNFLSPQFRQFIPHLAAHLKFEYEMITFTWPHWLRKQTEKQRIIWGYKILFLDVMFPLDLEKVIFVDADQIVRTDMIELINEDLHGKVWGYTPMCDSRKEIEGFRFWKQGYWKDFLRGKPYHISALYVIDLVAFRAQATGDRLRQQYHQLSADPASLSNLDQDLPNHLQAQIPIHSLPQEWLWCETWCSDETLKDAKTIDLCQNPMTKEPKLDRARRQLPEWNEYDRKIKEFAKTVAQREDEIASILVDVDSVGQNVEMQKDQLGDEEGRDDTVSKSEQEHDEL